MARRRRDQGGEASSFIGGLILGFIISAPVAAWMSPRSGSETRSEIRQQGIIIRRKTQRVVRKPIETIQEQIEQLQAKAGQLKGESVEDALREGRSIAARALGKEPDAPAS
jgi:gas vesicle protein